LCFRISNKINLKNLILSPLITRAEITSANLWDKFQGLELLIPKVFIKARGGENISRIRYRFNAKIKTIAAPE